MMEFKIILRGFGTLLSPWRFTRNAEQEEFCRRSLTRVTIAVSRFPRVRSYGEPRWAMIGVLTTTRIMPVLFRPARMKPLPYQASEGRANPKGIPYLYTATYHDTAIVEVRPWVGALVSVTIVNLYQSLQTSDSASYRAVGPGTRTSYLERHRHRIFKTRNPA